MEKRNKFVLYSVIPIAPKQKIKANRMIFTQCIGVIQITENITVFMGSTEIHPIL